MQRHPLPWRDPWALALALADVFGAEGLVWLDGDGSAQGQGSVLAAAPSGTVCCRGLPGQPGAQDPFPVLQELEASGGHWLGWLAYEAGAWVEPGPHWHTPTMASLWAGRYPALLLLNSQQQQCWLQLDGSAAGLERGRQIRALVETLPPGPPANAPLPPPLPLEAWHWHSSPGAFAAGVAQIRRWIAAGDLFQANLSACCEQELAAPPDALALYGRLRQHCPAPFRGLAIAPGAAGSPGPEAVLSASPERFLAVSAEGEVETRPIKGTRPRHSDRRRDAEAAADLVSHPKDRAENVMIVDLLRNDLGRVCQPGSIMVPQLVELESYAQVHHLTSVVTGRLRQGVGVADLLRACWPGGSITGAPKVRACQRLNSLEPVARGPYCGSLFQLRPDGSFDSNILIRSLLLQGSTLRAHAGCGIVADSDPQQEAEEMGWKLGPLLEALA